MLEVCCECLEALDIRDEKNPKNRRTRERATRRISCPDNQDIYGYSGIGGSVV